MPPAPEPNVTFVDHLLPAATPGIYRLDVLDSLTKDGAPVNTGAPMEGAQAYEIRAARFVIDPSSVHAQYPGDGAAGDFSRVLAHVTLDRKVLPWDRALTGVRREFPRGEIPWRPPWLALLVLGEGEADDDPAAQGAATNRLVADLVPKPADGIFFPNLSVTQAEKASPCRTIDLPAELFHAIVPRENELHYLAHIREVTTAPHRRDDGEVITEGEFAVIAGGRFPSWDGSYAAHLVSLEGFSGFLTPGSLPSGTQTVRLCTLWSWSFTSNAKGAVNPEQLLRDLVAPGNDNPENLALKLTPPGTTTGGEGPEGEARTRLSRGYTAVPFRALSGETTYAWYRGPLTPLTAPDVPAEPGPYTTADHALIYDPGHGVFDVSYAAAWTLGRAIALADPDYVTEITRARRELANRAVTFLALRADPARTDHDPDAPAGARALARLADRSFGPALRAALAAPRAGGPPPASAARTARQAPAALLADLRASASLSALAAAQTPGLPEWMDRLRLLYRVPFCYLVPDRRMLPPESLRAFRIDPGWIAALAEGAADVGAHTSTDRELTDTVLRQRRRDAVGPLPAAGMLMRSQLVAFWPDFDILATTSSGASAQPVAELRRDHLAPDVLLVLWDQVPGQLTIREPGQGIHFGINGLDRIRLRNLADSGLGQFTGTEFPDPPGTIRDYLRSRGPDDPAVLNLDGTPGPALVPDLAAACNAPGGTLTAGQLALELVSAPLQQVLDRNTRARS